VELPGIEPGCLPAETPSDLQVGSVSVRFSPARYLRFCSRVLTASRAVANREKLCCGLAATKLQVSKHRCTASETTTWRSTTDRCAKRSETMADGIPGLSLNIMANDRDADVQLGRVSRMGRR